MPNRYRTFKDLMSRNLFLFIIINFNFTEHFILDYPNLKDDNNRLEHFTTLCEVLKEYMGETYLPNTVDLLGIYGRVSKIKKM